MSTRESLLLLLVLVPQARSWGVCQNENPHCADWAKKGECTGENADGLKKICPHSCGHCQTNQLSCRDVKPDCLAWANAGQC